MGGIVVQATQQPTARHHILDIINAFPGSLGAWTVCHPEESTGDELNSERKSECASPDITPASAARDIFVQGRVQKFAAARALVEPVNQRRDARRLWGNLDHDSRLDIKLQAPSSKLQGKIKHQAPKRERPVVALGFEI